MPTANEITTQRERSLSALAERVGGREAVVFLQDADRALAAYAANVSQTFKASLIGLSVTLETTIGEPFRDKLLVRKSEKTCSEALRTVGLNVNRAKFYPLVLDPKTTALPIDNAPLIGCVLINRVASSKSHVDISSELSTFALTIYSRRNQRVIEAVNSTQNILTEQSNEASVEEIIRTVAQNVQNIISAKICLYESQDDFIGWRSVKQSSSKTEAAEKARQVGKQNTKQAIARGVVSVTGEKNDETLEGVISAPLNQKGVKLDNRSFLTSAEFIESFDEVDVPISSVLFLGKRNSGYLQREFSPTDGAVAQSVFGYMDQFVSAKSSQTNYHKVARFLKENQSSALIGPGEILPILRSLSVGFNNVFLIEADFVDGELKLTTSAADDTEALSHEYLERLRRNYLSKFYEDDSPSFSGRLMMGLDAYPGGFDFEFHFPPTEGVSRFFILRFDRDEITQGVLRALVHLFGEIEVRARKYDYDRSRANYLIQVRHAVIHHFAAADKGLSHMHARWRKGLRSVAYWAGLRADPIFRKSLQRSHYSLSQARLLLENGRFLLKEINPSSLNRKQFDIVAAVRNAFEILEDARELKGLTIKNTVNGFRPSVMNADQELMKIAILNLVDNALKFSPVKSTVVWKVSFEHEAYVFSIASGGARISEAQKRQIKKEGIRGKQMDHLNQKHGTGLGLAVTDKILFSHWPECELEIDWVTPDEIPTGANKFWFRMPYRTGTQNRTGTT